MKRVLITADTAHRHNRRLRCSASGYKAADDADDAWNDDERIHDEQLAYEHSGR